jgi:hypothetical protein
MIIDSDYFNNENLQRYLALSFVGKKKKKKRKKKILFKKYFFFSYDPRKRIISFFNFVYRNKQYTLFKYKSKKRKPLYN